MFALDSLVRNAVQQSVNVLHPENAPAPLDSAIHLEPYPFDVCINRSCRRKRGMASNPLFIIPDLFFCIFQTNFAMATLGLKEMGKGRPFSLPSQRNFPISFKPKVAIAEFFWKMQRKT